MTGTDCAAGAGWEGEELLAPVRVAFPSCCVRHAPAPSYVALHSPHSPPGRHIALGTLQLMQSKTPPPSADQPSKEEKHSEELDLTGSPLKLDLSLHNILDDTSLLDETQHWLKEEAMHLPMPLENARNVANLYNELLREIDQTKAVPLWIVCNSMGESKTILLTVQSYRDCFNRGLVTYEGEVGLDQISFEEMTNKYLKLDGDSKNEIQYTVDCNYRISGMAYASYKMPEDTLTAHHDGMTQLRCEWTTQTLDVPLHYAKISLEQEVIVGHERSPCHVLWKSITALNSLNKVLVDMTAAACAALNLNDVPVRPSSTLMLEDNMRRVAELLSEVETYTYTSQCQQGGCICIGEDTVSLQQCLASMEREGSSNDFTYKLWDILRDCRTAEQLIVLLLHTLKVVSTGKIKPFIMPSNKTYLAKLFLKLSRGHSQTGKVLKNLRSDPPQALSLLGQLAIEKTGWELTHLFTLVDNSFVVNNVLNLDQRATESIEQINQTLHDMTMGCDLSLNPFENRSLAENSIRLDCESFYDDDPKELSVDNFASLRKCGLVSTEKKVANETPLILDEIDVGCWKFGLAKFAQLFVCLEQLVRAQHTLRIDISSLKVIASKVQEHYVADKSPIKTVGQLINEPVQSFTMAVPCSLVQDQIKNKLASLYRVHLCTKPPADDKKACQVTSTTYVFSQQPVFPPSIWRASEPETDEACVNSVALKYHVTKYVYVSTAILSAFLL